MGIVYHGFQGRMTQAVQAFIEAVEGVETILDEYSELVATENPVSEAALIGNSEAEQHGFVAADYGNTIFALTHVNAGIHGETHTDSNHMAVITRLRIN